MIKEGKFTILEIRGAVAKLTINRPEKRNALSRDAIREILAVVLTTGAGDIAYCAGRDLSEFPTEGGQIAAKTGARSRALIMSLK
jgi:enoyl-CoA hydratase/carnithine racemase